MFNTRTESIRKPRSRWAALHRFRVEAPWILSATLALVSMFSMIPTLNHPWGSNWPMYFESARYFWDPTAAYFGWRPPLYPLSLATLGQPLGYVQAAHLIAQISLVIIVFGSALFARLMGGVWVSVLAVLTIPLLQCAVEGGMWTNMYPPAAAAFTLACALGACAWRKPSLGLALLAGLASGLAWRFNHLGLVAVPLAGGLTFLGATKIRARSALLSLPLLFGTGVGTLWSIDQWIIEHWDVPQEDLSTQVIQRRREELDRLQSGQADMQRFSGCTDFEPKPLNWTELTNTCGQQFVSANYGTLRAEDCIPSPKTLLWLLPLTLLPGAWRRDWRDSAASILSFGGPIGAFLIAAGWTSYAEKYAISFLPMMVLIVPLAFDRLGGWVGRLFGRISLGRTMFWFGAFGWIVYTWPTTTSFSADKPNVQRDWESVSGTVAQWAQTDLGSKDIFIDCVPLHIDLVLLPKKREIYAGLPTDVACEDWVTNPPTSDGNTWMVQQYFPEISSTQPSNLRNKGWVLIQEYDAKHRLWKYQP